MFPRFFLVENSSIRLSKNSSIFTYNYNLFRTLSDLFCFFFVFSLMEKKQLKMVNNTIMDDGEN